jgi:hypothetical protein
MAKLKPHEKAAAKAIAQYAKDYAAGKVGANGAPVAAKPAPKPAAKPAPVKPDPVAGFLTPDEIDAVNDFNTQLATKLQELRFEVGDYDEATNTWKGGTLETDTTYQKTGVDNAAKEGTAAATDDAIARGIFKSSVKDAALYDIEAQRSLQSKFLDDKLTSARLNAGTVTKTLNEAKTRFDENILTRKVNNATGVNDKNNDAWATAKAAWDAANPTLPGATAPGGAAKPPAKPAAKPTPKPTPSLFAPTPKPTPARVTGPNTASGTGTTKPRRVTSRVIYGGGKP